MLVRNSRISRVPRIQKVDLPPTDSPLAAHVSLECKELVSLCSLYTRCRGSDQSSEILVREQRMLERISLMSTNWKVSLKEHQIVLLVYLATGYRG